MSANTTVLLLGAGGREHALAWKLAQSPRLKNLFALPGSNAISVFAQCLPGDPCDAKTVLAAVQASHAKLVVIGPEAPLAAGIADALREAGVATFGPSGQAAQLESSKAYAKRFMTRHGIPTASYEVFTEAWRARAAVEAMKLPFVIKADGLAAGKGVKIIKETNDALGTVTAWMEKGEFGAAGKTLVVERCLEGPEVSILIVTDGKNYKILPPARDHKRLLDNDEGPNTGGMGAVAPIPLDEQLLKTIRETIIEKVLGGLRKDGLDYRGVLYIGLMLTKEGPKVLEFNCRFGDPETQAILPLLETDLLELALDCSNGSLPPGTDLKVRSGAAVCVTLASEGYPAQPVTGRAIEGLEVLKSSPEVQVFHAGTAFKDGYWVTTGGRVLGITAIGSDVSQARKYAYAALAKVHFDGMQYRTDIAADKRLVLK